MKGKLSKSTVYNEVAGMELKAMDEIHAFDIEKDRVEYYMKLGEINAYTRLKHFIATHTEIDNEEGENNE